ncbi:hypothetical protein ACGFYE_27865 [Streptomyces zaomyceticus]|uniref:hypothetical protein n=1 Tax=Streptomyces zaomyceticus TaxID=68286 RepID=UPI00371DCEA3
MRLSDRTTSRRTVLTALAAAATAGAPLVGQLATAAPAFATGAQLEITEDMRRSLFGPLDTDFDRKSGRIATWDNPRFLGFRDACRRAIATVEAARPIL